jgi:hypothetical protein
MIALLLNTIRRRLSTMRQLGVCAGSSANPKLTHGAEKQTNYPVEALECSS